MEQSRKKNFSFDHFVTSCVHENSLLKLVTVSFALKMIHTATYDSTKDDLHVLVHFTGLVTNAAKLCSRGKRTNLKNHNDSYQTGKLHQRGTSVISRPSPTY